MKWEEWVARMLAYGASPAVGDGELAQIVADHLRLDFHQVEGFDVVDAHHAAHHDRHESCHAGVSSSFWASLWAVPPSWPCPGAALASAASSAGVRRRWVRYGCLSCS